MSWLDFGDNALSELSEKEVEPYFPGGTEKYRRWSYGASPEEFCFGLICLLYDVDGLREGALLASGESAIKLLGREEQQEDLISALLDLWARSAPRDVFNVNVPTDVAVDPNRAAVVLRNLCRMRVRNEWWPSYRKNLCPSIEGGFRMPDLARSLKTLGNNRRLGTSARRMLALDLLQAPSPQVEAVAATLLKGTALDQQAFEAAKAALATANAPTIRQIFTWASEERGFEGTRLIREMLTSRHATVRKRAGSWMAAGNADDFIDQDFALLALDGDEGLSRKVRKKIGDVAVVQAARGTMEYYATGEADDVRALLACAMAADDPEIASAISSRAEALIAEAKDARFERMFGVDSFSRQLADRAAAFLATLTGAGRTLPEHLWLRLRLLYKVIPDYSVSDALAAVAESKHADPIAWTVMEEIVSEPQQDWFGRNYDVLVRASRGMTKAAALNPDLHARLLGIAGTVRGMARRTLWPEIAKMEDERSQQALADLILKTRPSSADYEEDAIYFALRELGKVRWTKAVAQMLVKLSQSKDRDRSWWATRALNSRPPGDFSAPKRQRHRWPKEQDADPYELQVEGSVFSGAIPQLNRGPIVASPPATADEIKASGRQSRDRLPSASGST